MVCSYCNLHYCVPHRHHGCKDDLMKSELKKLKVEQWKKPKEQFRVAKAEADKKVSYIILIKLHIVVIVSNLAECCFAVGNSFEKSRNYSATTFSSKNTFDEN